MTSGEPAPLDVLLVFPPSFEHYFMPEIALPRLTAYLTRKGYRAVQEDWNVLYWDQFLFDKRPFPAFLKWLRDELNPGEDCFYRPVLELFQRYLTRPRIDVEACRRFVYRHRSEIFQWVFEQTRVDDFSLNHVMRLTNQSWPLLDRFLQTRIRAILDGFEFSLLGVSIISPQQLVPTLRMITMLRSARPAMRVMAGGPWVKLGRHFLMQKEYRFLFRFFDVFTFGDGELPLEGVLSSGMDPRRLDEVPNLIHGLNPEGVTETREETSADLSALPSPMFQGLPLDMYPEKRIPLERASMCYYRKCSFCWHNHRDRRWNILPEAVVVDRMEEYVQGHSVRSFLLMDNAVNEAYSARFAREILNRGLKVQWMMQARFDPAFLDPAHAELLARAGCTGITFGLETARPDLLRRFNKGIDIKHVPPILRNTAEAGISNNLFVMLYPGESQSDFEETLKYCLSLRDDVDMVIVQRFQLNEYCLAHDEPHLLGLKVLPEPRVDLDFFKRPYESGGCIGDDAYFHRTLDRFRRLFRWPKELP